MSYCLSAHAAISLNAMRAVVGPSIGWARSPHLINGRGEAMPRLVGWARQGLLLPVGQGEVLPQRSDRPVGTIVFHPN